MLERLGELKAAGLERTSHLTIEELLLLRLKVAVDDRNSHGRDTL